MASCARVSAALIVRDEAAFIADCLRSLIDHVDEIVIVDTGSRDETIEIARRFPVALHHVAWAEDFSAARNAALDRASGDWILYIDADERLIVPDRETWQRLLADRRKAGYEVRFHPRVDWTPYAELRLFRNDPRIRFAGVIHERIRPGVDAVMQADGLELARCDVALQHVGYESDQVPKNPRNIPLLRAYLASEPDRLFCWWHLGECLRLAGEPDAAIEAWSNGIARMREIDPERRRRGDAIVFLSLMALLHQRGEAIDAPAAEAIAMFPGNLAVQWIAAQLAVARGDLDAAAPVLERLQAIDGETFFDPEVSYDKALFRHRSAETLALCRFRAGRFADAARLYRIAARTSPDAAACEVKARLAELRTG